MSVITRILIFSILLLEVCTKAIAQDRPNILWITFEDTSPQFIGCYGNENAETPVIDIMASEGIRYTSAFSTNTVCSPSRTSLITGVPTFKLGTGNHRSNYAIPEFIKGFPKYLRDAGYYVTNNHKTDYNVADEKAFIAETWDESSSKAGWDKRGQGQPFFSVFNIDDSHQSRTMSMPYEWYEKNVLAYLPQQIIKNKETIRDGNRYTSIDVESALEGDPGFESMHKKHWISEDAFEMPSIYHDSPEMRKQMARVYNSLKLTDIKIGKLLGQLQSDGLMKNTIIFIFADHGEGMPRMKTNGIGLGYRVPFVVWLPERYKHLAPNGQTGIVSEELVSFEDLAPTVLSLAGVSAPDYLQGRVLLGDKIQGAPNKLYLASDRADNGPDLVRSVTDGNYIYSRNFNPFYPEMKYIRYIEVGEITKQMRKDLQNGKLDTTQSKIFEPRPAELLYDLKNDSWETTNLVGLDRYAPLLKEMRNSLQENIVSQVDVQFMPEYELQCLSEYSTPYEEKMKKGYYPIEKVLETALLVGRDDLMHTQKKISALKSANKFVRYWASNGLYNQRKNLSVGELRVIKTHLNDSYEPVKVTLAALLYDMHAAKGAEQLLKNAINPKEPDIALMAINYLLYSSNRKPFIEHVQEIQRSEAPYKVKASALDFLDLEGLIPSKE